MIRGTLRALSRKRLGDTNETFWTNSEINTYINNACNDIAFRTKCLRADSKISSIDCTAGIVSAKSNEYTLSTNFTNIYSILEVYFFQDGTDWTELECTTRDELDKEHPGWRTLLGYTYTNTTTGVVTYNYESDPGTPTKYYWDREEDILGLYVPPDTTNAGSNYIHVYYSKKHTDIADGTTGDSETPTIPEPLHLAILDFVVASGMEDRGNGEKANDLWQKYYAKLNDYIVERKREREDEELVMVPEGNL